VRNDAVSHTTSDPIDSDDRSELRTEILRLRDLNLGAESRAEVLADRVAELEAQNTELNDALTNLNEANAALHVELGRSPLIRIARAIARRLNPR